MGTAEVVVSTTHGPPPADCDLSPPVIGTGTAALAVFELDRNVRVARGVASEVSDEIEHFWPVIACPTATLRGS